ncbi:MAG: two-component system, OmpR family, phosphate regulon sensor histidine kinase PhoR [Gaiellaceae bacterium]|nr:two-component system, OmpR family, phosphate regulon sensor histidine kinase PhoR [Gaiellaceae bacterium]
MAADFARLVSLACHDLRTPLATVQGFAQTLQRLDQLDEEKRARYLGLIESASAELVQLLDLLSLAARIEGGRYEPVVREADSLELAPEGATGTGAPVQVDPEPVERALAALARAAERHGGVVVAISVDGARVTIAPVVEGAAAVVLGVEQKDLGAAVAVSLLRALGGEVALDGERLTVTLPTA